LNDFSMAPEWLQIDLDRGVGVATHRATSSAPHRQWGVAIVIGLEADVEIVESNTGIRGRAVVVPPDVLHVTRSAGPAVTITLEADDHRQAMLELRRARRFPSRSLAPACSSRRSFSAASFSVDVPHVTARAGDIFSAAPTDRVAMSLALAGRLLPLGRDQSLDPRILLTTATLSAAGNTPLPELASAAGLSPAHFSTLFRTQVGLPLQRWKLWRRLKQALVELRPSQLTTAAVQAGFSDHAHLTRTCTRLLGYMPSAFARALER
jgi:AraC-like DNA-binding protein